MQKEQTITQLDKYKSCNHTSRIHCSLSRMLCDPLILGKFPQRIGAVSVFIATEVTSRRVAGFEADAALVRLPLFWFSRSILSSPSLSPLRRTTQPFFL